MKKLTAIIVAVLTILLLPNLTYSQQAEAPKYKDGDWWVFRVKGSRDRDGDYRVTYKNGEFEADDQDFLDLTVCIAVNLNDPQRKQFDFPLTTGKNWKSQYYYTSVVTGHSGWKYIKTEVTGPTPKPVETPAGRFKAIQIQRTEQWLPLEWKLTYFYSPETKSVVKVTAEVDSPRGEQHIEMDLIKYSVR